MRSFGTRSWRKILRSEGFDHRLAEQTLNAALKT
jgi:hypothetical protein